MYSFAYSSCRVIFKGFLLVKHVPHSKVSAIDPALASLDIAAFSKPAPAPASWSLLACFHNPRMQDFSKRDCMMKHTTED
jgi:hypothetical protein